MARRRGQPAQDCLDFGQPVEIASESVGRPPTARTFFRQKREWSRMKDEIVGAYAQPYFAKVAHRLEPLRVVDGFAGPGMYDDGSCGSPLILLEAAQRYAKGRYRATFVNNDREHHEALLGAVHAAGAGLEVECLCANCSEALGHLAAQLPTSTDTLFLYLDPFGPSATPFAMVEPFLQRPARFSTEIVIVLNITAMFRMAGSVAHHATLTRVLGGEEWREHLGRGQRNDEATVARLVEVYADRFRQYGFLVGTCPIRKRRGLLANFYVLSASRREDGILLMNDIMHNAYERFLGETSGRLALGAEHDEGEALKQKVLDRVRESPGIHRERLWVDIVSHEFRRFSQKQFRATVKDLVEGGYLRCESDTGRLNDRSRLVAPRPLVTEAPSDG